MDGPMDEFWAKVMAEIASINPATENWKSQTLPLARMKKIMKSEEYVNQELEHERLMAQWLAKSAAGNTDEPPPKMNTRFMIAGEAPILLSKASEFLIRELTVRAWRNTKRNRRKILQRQDVYAAVGESDVFDFLIDFVPRIPVGTSSGAASSGLPAIPSSHTMGAASAAAAAVAPSPQELMAYQQHQQHPQNVVTIQQQPQPQQQYYHPPSAIQDMQTQPPNQVHYQQQAPAPGTTAAAQSMGPQQAMMPPQSMTAPQLMVPRTIMTAQNQTLMVPHHNVQIHHVASGHGHQQNPYLLHMQQQQQQQQALAAQTVKQQPPPPLSYAAAGGPHIIGQQQQTSAAAAAPPQTLYNPMTAALPTLPQPVALAPAQQQALIPQQYAAGPIAPQQSSTTQSNADKNEGEDTRKNENGTRE